MRCDFALPEAPSPLRLTRAIGQQMLSNGGNPGIPGVINYPCLGAAVMGVDRSGARALPAFAPHGCHARPMRIFLGEGSLVRGAPSTCSFALQLARHMT